MSFLGATSYLSAYREQRAESYNNVQPRKWFTYGVDELVDLFGPDLFNSDEENDEWQALYEEDPDVQQMTTLRIKVAYLASLRRDLRMQFAAWRDHRPRVALDFDRYENMRLYFKNFRTEMLTQMLDERGYAPDTTGSASGAV